MHGQYTKACKPSKFSLSSEGQNSSVKKQSNLVSSGEEIIPDNIQINVLPAGETHVQLDLVSKIGSDIMNAEPFGNTQFKIMDGQASDHKALTTPQFKASTSSNAALNNLASEKSAKQIDQFLLLLEGTRSASPTLNSRDKTGKRQVNSDELDAQLMLPPLARAPKSLEKGGRANITMVKAPVQKANISI